MLHNVLTVRTNFYFYCHKTNQLHANISSISLPWYTGLQNTCLYFCFLLYTMSAGRRRAIHFWHPHPNSLHLQCICLAPSVVHSIITFHRVVLHNYRHQLAHPLTHVWWTIGWLICFSWLLSCTIPLLNCYINNIF